MSSQEKITIIGGGLAGPLLSLYLAKKNIHVNLYEKRDNILKKNIKSGGRSINLAISERGIRPLKELNIFDKIEPELIPMKGRMIHDQEGNQKFYNYGKNNNEYINSVSRYKLNYFLLSELEQYTNATVTFNKKCVGYNTEKQKLKFNDGENIKITGPIIGTDGSSSIISKVIANKTNTKIKEDVLSHIYKELTIPAKDNDFQLEPNALHIWPRKSMMIIALPNIDRSFTCTMFIKKNGNMSLSSLESSEKILSFFQKHFINLLTLIPDIETQFKKNPVSNLSTIYTEKWNYKNLACVLGDAAHAIVPFFGQGMNASFEDCFEFNKLVQKKHNDWTAVFNDFYNKRKKNADAIATMALENFVEMKDHVIDDKFLLNREVEKYLEKKFPDYFIPRYSMVSFSNIPYEIVQKRGAIQQSIISKLSKSITNINQINLQKAKKLIINNLDKHES